MNDELNNILKNHVERHEKEVDPQEIWDGILRKRKRRKSGWLLYFLPFCLVIGLYFSSNTFQVRDQQELSSISEIKRDRQESSLSQADLNADIKETKNNTASELVNTIENNINQDQISNDPTTEKPTSAVNKLNLNTTQKSLKENPKAVLETAFNSQRNNSVFQEDKRPQSESILKDINLEKTILRNYSKIEIINPALVALPSRSINNAQIIVSPKKHYNPLSVNLVTGFGLLDKNTKPVLPENELFGSINENATEALDAHSVSLLLEIPIRKNFSINTGLHYEKQYERLNWSASYLTDDKGEKTIINFDDNGEPIYSYTSSNYYQTTTEQVTSYQNFQTIDLPIQLNYILNASRLSTSIYAGMMINLSSTLSGIGLDENLNLVNLSEIESFKKPSHKYQAGLAINYGLTSKLYLSSGFNLATRTWTDDQLENKYLTYGINLGFGYMLK